MNAAPPALRASTVTTVKMTAVSNKMINRIILIHLLSIKGIVNFAKKIEGPEGPSVVDYIQMLRCSNNKLKLFLI